MKVQIAFQILIAGLRNVLALDVALRRVLQINVTMILAVQTFNVQVEFAWIKNVLEVAVLRFPQEDVLEIRAHQIQTVKVRFAEIQLVEAQSASLM